MATKDLTVALAGNPNSGKTSIFNNLTGARQHVGNYPGVTIEKREGFCRFQGKNLLVIDLPGTYSLTANALDELVARNVIINDKPDIIVNILDASNLERNLYLTVQLLELERPVVLALNMADVAEKAGQKIDDKALTSKLNVPVARTVGNRNRGTDDLLKVVVDAAMKDIQQPFMMDYGPEIEAKIKQVADALARLSEVNYPLRWLAIKLLENDQDVYKSISFIPDGGEALDVAGQARTELNVVFEEDLELIIAERRYYFAGKVYQEVIASQSDLSQTASDQIDQILTHRVLGLPIFFAIMWLLFNIVFTLGAYPQDWLETGVSSLGKFIAAFVTEGDLKSLIADGIIGGVGSVLVFLPQILLLFLGISLLEDTGYMARAAFIMDRVMRAVGLHGKSFIPLLLGFGCSVPAIMGTRTLENPRDRLVTMLVAPLMSCSARLPVYTLLTAAFFSENIAGSILFSLYFLGIMLAISMAMIFRKFLFPGTTEPFVMEMPPYHLPTVRSILTHMWERSVLYLKKAGTLILAASIFIWFMTNYPTDAPYSKDYVKAKAQVNEAFTAQIAEKILIPLGIDKLTDNASLNTVIKRMPKDTSRDSETVDSIASATSKGATLEEIRQREPATYPYVLQYLELYQKRNNDYEHLKTEQSGERLTNSYAGRFGHMLEPIIRPLGFDWKIGVGLFSAVAAKEVLVSTLGTIYSASEDDENPLALQEALAASPSFTPLVAYTLMVFTLIYSPCLAALAVMRRETNSWKWPVFSTVYATVLAWLISFGIYRVGLLLGYQ